MALCLGRNYRWMRTNQPNVLQNLGFFRSTKCRPDQTLTEADKGASTTPGSWCFPWGAQPGSYRCICVLHHGPVPLLPVRTEQGRVEQKGFCACPRSLGSLGSCCFAVISAPPRRGLLDPRPVGDRAKPPCLGWAPEGLGSIPEQQPRLLLWCPLSSSRLMEGFLAISDTLCPLTPKVSCSQKPALSLEVKGRGLQALERR